MVKQTWFMVILFALLCPVVFATAQSSELTQYGNKIETYLKAKGFDVEASATGNNLVYVKGKIEEKDEQGALRKRVFLKTYRSKSVKDYLDPQDRSKFRIIKNPKPGTVWHDYTVAGEYGKSFDIYVRLVEFKKLDNILKDHLEDYTRGVTSLKRNAESQDLEMNVRQSPDYVAIFEKERKEMAETDGHWLIPDFQQGTKAFIAAQVEKDYYLWGESTYDDVQFNRGIAFLGGGTAAKRDHGYNEKLHMRVLFGNLSMEVRLSCSEGAWNTLRHRASSDLPALGIMGDLYTVFTNKPFPYQLDQQQVDTTLTVTSSSNQLVADGMSMAKLLVTVTRKKGDVAGLPIDLKIVPFAGKALGALSATTVKTDTSGLAQAVYTSPFAEGVDATSSHRVEIQANCAAVGLRDTLYLDLVTKQPVHVTTKHNILPAHKSYPNELSFTFNNPNQDWGKDYEAIISCLSEHGQLSVGRQAGQRLVIKDAVSGSENAVFYRWQGPQVTKAFAETVTVEIPKLGISGTVNFSVGMDLVLDSAPLAWKGPFYSGLAIPIKATIKDRFHPEASVDTLLESFGIKPNLTINQKSFTPVAIGSVLEDDFATRLIKGMQGSVIPRGSFLQGVFAGVVKQTEQGWLLVDPQVKGMASLARVTPYDMGSYLFELTLQSNFKGDASDESQTLSVQVAVEQIPPDEETFFTFLIPTTKAYLALYPGVEEWSTLVELSAMAYEGRLGEAVFNMGYEFAMKGAKKIATDLAKKGMGSVGQCFMKELEKRLTPETWTRVKKITDKASKTWNDAELQETMDTLDLDIVGHYVGAFVENKLPTNEASQAYLQQFLKGTGEKAVLVIASEDSLDVQATDSQGQSWQPTEKAWLSNHANQRLYQGIHTTVIPFDKAEQFNLSLSGEGEGSVRIFKVTEDGTKVGELDYQGQRWQKQLTIHGNMGEQ